MREFASSQIDYLVFVVTTVVVFALLGLALRKWRYWARLPRPTWFIVITVMVVGWWPVEEAGHAERMEIESVVTAMAPVYAKELSRAGHALLDPTTPADDPVRRRIVQLLDEWMAQNPMANDIYTMRKLPDGRQIFIADGDTDYNHDGHISENEKGAEAGEIYTHVEPGLTKALEGTVNFDPTLVQDRWGSWVSAWAPIPGPDGKPEAVVGIDYDAHLWLSRIREARLHRITELILLLITIGASMTAIGVLQGQVVLRRRAEEEHLRAERRLRLTLEQMPLACLEMDTRGIIIGWNPAAEMIFGYTREDVVGKMHFDVIVAPSARSQVHELWKDLQSEPVSRRSVNDNVTRDGRIIRCEWFVSQVIDQEGKVVSILSLGQDVSERISLEEQVRQAQRMTAVGQLAAGVAHDFNNLLTVIQGHTHLLLDRTDFPGDSREDVERISAASDRAANLTRQLLTFSRKQAMFCRPLDLNQTVTDTKHLLERTLGANVTLTSVLANKLPRIEADPTMIDQVLTNLAVNARDAMPDGGTLVFRTELIDIPVEEARSHPERRAGRFVRLSVIDSGTGIAPEIQPRIFEPFFTTKDVGKGTGLGLSAVHGIVKQHGGWIEVRSTVGRGTTFLIYLPPTDKMIPEAGASRPLSPSRHGKMNVLLVEDERSVRLLARTALERAGFSVFDAEDGPSAEKIWSEHKGEIHVVATDMVMPNGISGRELAQRLCAERPDLPIVFASGYTMEMTAPEFAETPTQTFLQKPYLPRQLLAAVDRVLQGSSSPGSNLLFGSPK